MQTIDELTEAEENNGTDPLMPSITETENKQTGNNTVSSTPILK